MRLTKNSKSSSGGGKTRIAPKMSSLAKSAWVARRVSLVVKRKGHEERFDDKKSYASCYFACRSTHMAEQECELISSMVVKRLKAWLATRKRVDSKHIFEFIGEELQKIRPEAAFMYKTHRDIS